MATSSPINYLSNHQLNILDFFFVVIVLTVSYYLKIIDKDQAIIMDFFSDGNNQTTYPNRIVSDKILLIPFKTFNSLYYNRIFVILFVYISLISLS
jgi:hypothetical protein